jgi:MGT family glycosyltransferase
MSTINFINQVRFNKNGKKLHLTSFNKRIKRYGGKYDWGEYGYRLRGKEIVLADAEIDFPLIPKIRKDCCYVGGCVDFSRKEERFDWSIVDKEKTLVYCSVGMLKWNEDVIAKFFSTVIKTFQENSQWELIVHIAREEYYTKFINLELSKNIHVFNTVPQIEILSKSSLFISHGGFSSIREAICCGVPLIVCPIGVDQPGNAARIVYHNLGISIDINEMTTQSLLKQVIQTLSNSTIYHSVKKMQKVFLENSKYSEGVKFIDNYIRKQNGEK